MTFYHLCFLLYRQGRLERDEGLSFLPNTVHKGLSGCASRGRGPGKAPITINNDSESLTANQEQNLHLWSSRVWLGQLGQWRGLTGEIAHAITLVYPTIRSFYNACKLAESQSNNQGKFDLSLFSKQIEILISRVM